MKDDLLNKIAQVIPTRSKGPKLQPEAPAHDQVAPSKKPASQTPHISSGTSAVLAVQQMQKAMKELAAAVTRDESAPNNISKTPKKAFNDFISEQYVSANPESDNTKINFGMDALRELNAPTFKADGIWGPATDSGLHNILNFAYSLLHLEGDFGLPNNIYSLKQWQDFQNILSDYKLENNRVSLSFEDKKNKAVVITAHIEVITKLYNHFRQQISARPEYRPLIEGTRSFEKYSPNAKSTLTPAEAQTIKNPLSIVPNVKYQPADHSKFFTSIPLSALSSKEEYMKYMTNIVGVDEAQAVSLFNTIKSQIEAM